jgi:DNA-binding cell septation regulator SpoVG
MHSEIKGLKAHKGEKGYWLKMPRRPIKLIGFKDWPTNGFTTALGTTRVRSEDGWAR